jgi:pimeloyl-ACP methyl ester carboxylesterase
MASDAGRFYAPHSTDEGPQVPIVVVHGASSSPSLLFEALLPLASTHDRPLLAPTFRGSSGEGYQQLAADGEPLGAVRTLEDALGRASARLGHRIEQIDLFGFSGGAQFAHRYALVRPHRVRRYAIAGAGWYTRLDATRPFPQGIGASRRTGGRHIDVEAFLRIPGCVIAGERDVSREGRLRTTRRIDEEQGEHRLARALRWVDHVGYEAACRGLLPPVRFHLLPTTGHSFKDAMLNGGLGEVLADALATAPSRSGG